MGVGGRGRFLEYLLSRPEVASVWHRYIYHPFVLGLGNGRLPLDSFKNYLIQDYLYLVHFARANALASYKSKNMEDIAAVSVLFSRLSRRKEGNREREREIVAC